LDCQVFSSIDSGLHPAVHSYGRPVCPSWNARVQSEILGLRWTDRQFNRALPRVAGLLCHLDRSSVLQAPIQAGIVIQVHIQTIFAGAVEITWQRSERALEIRRAAGYVIPCIADIRAASETIQCGRIERQWIS